MSQQELNNNGEHRNEEQLEDVPVIELLIKVGL